MEDEEEDAKIRRERRSVVRSVVEFIVKIIYMV